MTRAIELTGSRGGPTARRAGSLLRYAVPAVLLAGPVVLALFGPLLAEPEIGKGVSFSTAPGHPLGTDFVGRDVWNQVLLGGRSVVLIAVLATLATYVVAVPYGLASGMTRHRLVDEVLMRPLDVLLAVPSMLLLLLLASVAPGVSWVLGTVVVLINLPEVVRTSRAAALAIAGRPAVEAMRLQGEGWWRVATGYVARSMLRTLAADLGTRMTGAIYLVASAGFLGVGLSAQSSDWAAMVDRNRTGLFLQPWAVVMPALLILLLVIGINLLFDQLLRRRNVSRAATRRRREQIRA